MGAGPSELGSEFSKRSRHLGKDKRSSRTPHTSHFLVDPSHGPFSFLEMLRSPIKIAPCCLLKFGQRAKFAWNKKKKQQKNEQWETGTDQWFIRRGNAAIMWPMNIDEPIIFLEIKQVVMNWISKGFLGYRYDKISGNF